MRPNVQPSSLELYECYDCGKRVEMAKSRTCPDCGGPCRNIGRERDY